MLIILTSNLIDDIDPIDSQYDKKKQCIIKPNKGRGKRGRPTMSDILKEKKRQRRQRYINKRKLDHQLDPVKKYEWEKKQRELRKRYQNNKKRRNNPPIPYKESESMINMKLIIYI